MRHCPLLSCMDVTACLQLTDCSGLDAAQQEAVTRLEQIQPTCSTCSSSCSS